MAEQCSKLRVHPAPGVHILVAGCTDVLTCAPGRCMLFEDLQYSYMERAHENIARCIDFPPHAPDGCIQ